MHAPTIETVIILVRDYRPLARVLTSLVRRVHQSPTYVDGKVKALTSSYIHNKRIRFLIFHSCVGRKQVSLLDSGNTSGMTGTEPSPYAVIARGKPKQRKYDVKEHRQRDHAEITRQIL